MCRSEGKFVIVESLAALDNLDWEGVLYQLAPNGILVDHLSLEIVSGAISDEILVNVNGLYYHEKLVG